MAALNNNLAYLGLYTATLYRFYLVSQEAREKHTKFTVDTCMVLGVFIAKKRVLLDWPRETQSRETQFCWGDLT